MNWRRVQAVLIKEWQDIRTSRSVLGTMVLMPMIFVALALGTNLMFELIPDADLAEDQGGAALTAAMIGLGPRQAIQLLISDQYMIYILMVPISLPMSVVSYSIVGEKETRSLEPLLASPLTTLELLVGKTLTAVLPSTLIAWASFLLILAGNALIVEPVVWWQIARPTWTLGIALLSPLLACLTALLGVGVSARVQDARAAKSLIGALVVPIILLATLMLLTGTSVTLTHMMITAAVLLLILMMTTRLTITAFDRENILTRWGQ